jgi:hypothetical protein
MWTAVAVRCGCGSGKENAKNVHPLFAKRSQLLLTGPFGRPPHRVHRSRPAKAFDFGSRNGQDESSF